MIAGGSLKRRPPLFLCIPSSLGMDELHSTFTHMRHTVGAHSETNTQDEAASCSCLSQFHAFVTTYSKVQFAVFVADNHIEFYRIVKDLRGN